MYLHMCVRWYAWIMHVCVFMNVFTYVCTLVCMDHACVCVYIYIHIYTSCMHVFIYVCIYACMYERMYVGIFLIYLLACSITLVIINTTCYCTFGILLHYFGG
jgi:hypothetical protein